MATAAAAVAEKMRADRARNEALLAAIEDALRRGDVAAARATLLASRAPPSAVVEAVALNAPSTPVMESSAPR